MKKHTLLMTLIAAALLFAACGEKTAPTVSLYDLTRDMCAADHALPSMSSISSSDEKAAELFTYFADFDYEKVDAYYLTYAADGAPFELGVIALKDAGDVKACEDALKAHIEGRVNLYKSYAPDYVPQAEQADVLTEGRYVALVMCKDRTAAGQAFFTFLRAQQ